MTNFDPVGYVHQGAIYCPTCAARRYPPCREHGEYACPQCNPEVGAIFSTDGEGPLPDVCDDCGEFVRAGWLGDCWQEAARDARSLVDDYVAIGPYADRERAVINDALDYADSVARERAVVRAASAARSADDWDTIYAASRAAAASVYAEAWIKARPQCDYAIRFRDDVIDGRL